MKLLKPRKSALVHCLVKVSNAYPTLRTSDLAPENWASYNVREKRVSVSWFRAQLPTLERHAQIIEWRAQNEAVQAKMGSKKRSDRACGGEGEKGG